LIYAVRLNKPLYVELLLKYGADPNVCDIEGNIPLFVSCKRNNYEKRIKN
jgi:ankyrin repeat protein